MEPSGTQSSIYIAQGWVVPCSWQYSGPRTEELSLLPWYHVDPAAQILTRLSARWAGLSLGCPSEHRCLLLPPSPNPSPFWPSQRRQTEHRDFLFQGPPTNNFISGSSLAWAFLLLPQLKTFTRVGNLFWCVHQVFLCVPRVPPKPGRLPV
jgi:hypothetical protein